MDVEVSVASKKDQKLSRTAAAVYVINEEDIRRSGLTSVAELLRMVPGMEVAQINANNWAITSRGFNERFADTILVLIDGRSLYSPNFAGIFWQIEQVPVDQIERIEVIRGPGAAVWGANAVTGVINIVTKKARDTQGGVLSGGGGMQERDAAEIEYGAMRGARLAYRVYGSYFDRSDFETSSGQKAGDYWQGARGGFRADLQPTERDEVTLEGDVNDVSTRGQTNVALFGPPFAATPFTTSSYIGGDFLGRWTRTYSSTSEMSLKVSYEELSRDDILTDTVENIADAAFQDRFGLGSRQELVWGAEYRFTSCPTTSSPFVSFRPSNLATHLGSFFVQDEIALVPNLLWFTPGLEIEHSPFTGLSIEPSGRLLWQASKTQTLWISVAQATRTPQRSERGLNDVVAVFPGAGGALTSIELFGSPAASDETYLDFELGYRAKLSSAISADVSTLYDHYGDLQTQEPGAPFQSTSPVPHTVDPLFFENRMHGKGYGGELFLSWKPFTRWKLQGGYSFLKQVLKLNPGSLSPVSTAQAGDNPVNQFQIHSQLDFPHRIEFDTAAYFVGKLANEDIPRYTRLDQRVSWRPYDALEVELIGQNLLQPRHLEFLSNTGLVPTYSSRRAFVRLTWRFAR